MKSSYIIIIILKMKRFLGGVMTGFGRAKPPQITLMIYQLKSILKSKTTNKSIRTITLDNLEIDNYS